MAKALVTYYSRTKHTKKMAEIIADNIGQAGHEVTLAPVADLNVDDLPAFDGIVLGSPTYYGVMAGPMKEFIDQSVKYHGQLAGKLGAAFASSGNVGGGNETTVLSLIQALLIHGMLVLGDAEGDHYGPVSIGAPDERAEGECQRFGRRFGQFLTRLFPA
ncbi:MAG: NAD(P)H-dependent oxidoreductase [Proteobacteria bacterium]|nr:NAD(P)H-dependent oxidoreductase [Pseudomonadota bacterium]